MGKRGNGEGTVYKDKHNQWWAKLAPDEQTGKRPKRKADSQRHGISLLKQMQREREQGRNHSLQDPTFADFAAVWLAEKIKPHRERSTYQSYATVCRVHAVPSLGKLKLSKITTVQAQRAINAMLTNQYHIATVRQVRTIMVNAFNVAKEWGYISVNPFTNVSVPDAPKRKVVPLTTAHVLVLFDALQGDRLEPLYHLTLMYGLRKGEACALLISEYRSDAMEVDASGTIEHVTVIDEGDVACYRRKPSTKNGETRTLSLTSGMCDMIDTHLARLASERRLYGMEWKEQGLLFPNERGGIFTPSMVRTHFRKLLKRAGVPHCRFHDLRHTAASMMLDNGTPLKTVSTVLGHKNIAITANLYGHTYDASKRNAAEQQERRFKRPS